MQIGNITMRRLQLPARAGQLQAEGATAALIRELGTNYRQYHAFLREELEKVGRVPVPADFSTQEEYLDRWDWIQELLRAEALLRNCKRFVENRRSLQAPASAESRPLIDSNDHLVSIEEP
jgi:hypothetical protein